MRHRRRYIAIAFLLLSVSPTLARRYTESEIKAMFTFMPLPGYPYHARSIHMTGEGLFRLLVNEQGRVTSVVPLQSTGERELDNEAVKTYMRWQARPGPKREVDVPTKFTMR